MSDDDDPPRGSGRESRSARTERIARELERAPPHVRSALRRWALECFHGSREHEQTLWAEVERAAREAALSID